MSNEIMNISGVSCYEKDGTAYLNLEAVARGLGFVKKADSGNEVVNWTRVRGYLSDLGVEQKCTTGDYIPENIFYRLAMKAKNETAEKFQALVADEIIPTIRRTGGYVANEDAFIDAYLSYADEQTKLLFRSTLETVKRLKGRTEKSRLIHRKSVTSMPLLIAGTISRSERPPKNCTLGSAK